MMSSAWVHRVAVVGPGFDDWPNGREVLRGERAYQRAPTRLPDMTPLPASDRRRAGRVVRLAVACAAAASADEAATTSAVFTSSTGDGVNCDALCKALALPARELSPIKFMNSVHNAAAGYWGIAVGATAAATALCCHDGSASAGLIEAFAQLSAGAPSVLLVAYDAEYPQPLHAARPTPDAFAAAMLLKRQPDAASVARLELRLTGREAPTQLDDPALEELRSQIPAARLLPLLERLAREREGECVLEYLDDLSVALKVTPA